MKKETWFVLLCIIVVSSVGGSVIYFLGSIKGGILLFLCAILFDFVVDNSYSQKNRQRPNKDRPPKKGHSPFFIIFLIAFIVEAVLVLHLSVLAKRDMNDLYEKQHPASRITVYITTYGSYYHAPGCGALWNSCHETTLRQAVLDGYADCDRCFTPAYVAEYEGVDTWGEYLSSDYFLRFIENHVFQLSLTLFTLLIFFPSMVIIWYTRCQNGPMEAAHTPTSQNSSTQTELPATPEQKTCQLVWLSTYHVARHFGVSLHPTMTGYILAAMMYISAKHIRSQDIVDKIYSHFESAASYVNDGAAFPTSTVAPVLSGYKSLAPRLNASGIDPRSPSGLDELWKLISREVSKYRPPHPDARQAYLDYARILAGDARKYNSSSDS